MTVEASAEASPELPLAAADAEGSPSTEPREPATDLPERKPLGPARTPLALTDQLAVAGRKAMWVHLDRLLAREPGVRDPERPDELRKYRVAIRRVRAALRMFAAAYPKGEVKPLRGGLGNLARTVGAVRDLDLRIADLDRWALERGGDTRAAVLALSSAWRRDRERALAALLKRLDSRRHRRFLERLIGFVEEAPGAEGERPRHGTPARTVGDRLASQVWAVYEDVRAFGPVLRGADLETIHELRIAGKRLRDVLDLLSDVLPTGQAWLSERLVALQDHLGSLNDATVAVAAVRAFLDRRDSALGPRERTEIAAYLAKRELEVAALRQSISQAWRPVAGIGFARRLSSLVVARPASPAS
jgi:CHAD domain-containing protein